MSRRTSTKVALIREIDALKAITQHKTTNAYNFAYQAMKHFKNKDMINAIHVLTLSIAEDYAAEEIRTVLVKLDNHLEEYRLFLSKTQQTNKTNK